jgi:hypothetical protein
MEPDSTLSTEVSCDMHGKTVVARFCIASFRSMPQVLKKKRGYGTTEEYSMGRIQFTFSSEIYCLDASAFAQMEVNNS